MSLDAFRRALDALAEPVCCEGTLPVAERLAIMLPDGDVAAADDPHFVDWLVEHGEPAPFGHAGETKLDPAVRRAIRLRARGEAQVTGFDLAPAIAEIEAALSPRRHLVATLTDVLVYPPGGHFAPHKDTPTDHDLLGTLIVGLPIAHAGGAFHIHDGLAPHVVDWSTAAADPMRLRWVAVFSDVDHSIDPVMSGARVTLVYALTRSAHVRLDPARDQRYAALTASARRLQLPPAGPLMIACTRHVIGLDGPQPQGIGTLRGTDRDIAAILASCGFTVTVRTCLAARNSEEDPYDDEPRDPTRFRTDGELYFARLDRPITAHDVAELLDCVTFEPQPWGDGGGYFDEDASTLAPFLAGTVPIENWVFRRSAAATFLRAIDFSDDGFVGNGAYGAYLYKLAALEVTRR